MSSPDTKRVLRGGSWFYLGGSARSAQRLRDVPGSRDDSCGFRLALPIEQPRPKKETTMIPAPCLLTDGTSIDLLSIRRIKAFKPTEEYSARVAIDSNISANESIDFVNLDSYEDAVDFSKMMFWEWKKACNSARLAEESKEVKE